MKREHAQTIDVTSVETRLGRFAVAATPRGIAAVVPINRDTRLGDAWARREPALRRRMRLGATIEFHAPSGRHPASLARATAAMRGYAAGRVETRGIAVDLDGTPFQLAVWKRLCAIPAGSTISYGEIAAAVGRPRAARAVGGAVGANPVPILVPCHRVIGRDGSLTGFGFGLPMKRALLRHEERTGT